MKDLVHESISAEPDDWIRLQFPGRRTIEVRVVSWARESMVVDDGDGIVAMDAIGIPFSVGHVSGKLMGWKIKDFPDSAPCMIVSNMGKEWRKE